MMLLNPRIAIVELGREYPSTNRGDLAALQRRLARQLEARGVDCIAVDFSGTEFIGAAFLGVMIRVARLAQSAGKDLVLCGVRRQPAEVLRVIRLGKFFATAPNVRTVEPRQRVRRLRRLAASRARKLTSRTVMSILFTNHKRCGQSPTTRPAEGLAASIIVALVRLVLGQEPAHH